MTSDVNQILTSLAHFDVGSFKDEKERTAAVLSLREVLDTWKRPIDHIFELNWIQPAYISALKITIDADMYTKWVTKDAGPKTTAELSEISGIDQAILIRLLRHIVAMNGLKQPKIGTYSLTPFTASLAGPGNQDAFRMMFEQNYPAFLNLPNFLAKKDYKGPLDPAAGNWQDLHKDPRSYIEYLWLNSERAQSFHRLMKAYNSTTPDWVDLYPSEQLVQDMRPGKAVVVDIGGSTGADLIIFQKKHPGLPDGSLILQDLEGVIKEIPAPEGIMPVVQDVFQPQAVHGAKCYLMHFLLHGFNDEQSLTALKNLAAVMEKGYSKLLLHEMVVDDEKLSPAVTSMDLNMMSTLAASERTKQDWTNLLDQAGLRVTNVYSAPTIHESIVEAELA